jgi:hypothetical protein
MGEDVGEYVGNFSSVGLYVGGTVGFSGRSILGARVGAAVETTVGRLDGAVDGEVLGDTLGGLLEVGLCHSDE